MDLQQHLILIKGEDRTYAVESIRRSGHKCAVKFQNSKTVYSYLSENVVWLSNPMSLSLEDKHIFVKGRRVENVKALGLFSFGYIKYYALTYSSGSAKHYSENEVEIRRSCLDGKAKDVFGYLQRCASINMIGADEDDESKDGILSSIYAKIDFIDEETSAAAYLHPQCGVKQWAECTPIFPFGCNGSQKKAVEKALSNQISVVQGPPGTGKTQTILNIVANLLAAGKTALIVSNNNSATRNVWEKLVRNGFGFLVAPLGSRANKEAFIVNQPPLNPELPMWRMTPLEFNRTMSEAKVALRNVGTSFGLQERLACCRQELAEVELEQSHFQQENICEFSLVHAKVSSSRILKFLARVKSYAQSLELDSEGKLRRIRRLLNKLGVELRLRLSLGIKESLTEESIPEIVTLLDNLFYLRRIRELKSEIERIENHLSRLDAEDLVKSLTDSSMAVLKASISQRFKEERTRISSVRELYGNGDEVLKDYPIVLSTTFSSKMCFNSDTLFDYVIMDEASQVSVETGFLALTCARSAVIVGDTKQLPNVITEEDRVRLEEIRESSCVSDSYDCSAQSFLSSVLSTIPDLPVTLLREHYRCHPDIIGFCNQKFYGGNLLIMTNKNDAENHLFALTTSAGHHCRGHYNQREIDAVKLELLPHLQNLDEVGIITPYNSQVEQFRSQMPEIEVATVHKYQGREKDTIIMSVTDDVINQFSDDANLLNVAVSRAQNKFFLVVSGNTQELQGNIHDLLGYIRYRHGSVIQSKLRSIYDYLFTQIESKRGVSDYASENLTFELIERIRLGYPQLSHIKVLCHYPMRALIRDVSGLTRREARYAMHPSTHIDFLIINRVSKEPLLAIETDGYNFHNEATEQYERDRLKDHILKLYGLSLLRLSTVGHSEEQKIVACLLSNRCSERRDV